MPRLRAFVVRANELDARYTMALLGDLLTGHDGTLESLSELIEDDAELARQFQDGTWLEEGRRLRYHGFFYELTRDAEHPDRVSIIGWPVAAGRTGVRAYVFRTDAVGEGTLWLHGNASGYWSGERGAPEPPAATAGWSPAR